MLAGLASWVIVGHSERRRDAGETDALIGRKLQRAIEAGLRPILCVGEQLAEREGSLLAEQLRTALPKLRLLVHCDGGSFKSQFKRADKSGAELALILGEEEVRDQTIGVKLLRKDGEQITLKQSELVPYLQSFT